MRPGTIVTLVIIGIFVGISVLMGLNLALGFVSSAVNVVQQQTDPHELLRKYTWFKEAHSQLDAMRANIGVYDSRLASAQKASNGRAPSRTEMEAYLQWTNEKAGVVAAYNNLAADYNAKMAEVQWSFCNVGQLPPGATEALPRSYAPYTTSL